MMIHRQLIGLWAVLLLAPSAWAQEAGEEIIAKFKQSILDRRQAIRNAKVEVRREKFRPAESNELIPGFKREEVPERQTQTITVSIDYTKYNYRVVESGDLFIIDSNNQKQKVTDYQEHGMIDGRPIHYWPRAKNIHLLQQGKDGTILSVKNQEMCHAKLMGMEPVLAALGTFPFGYAIKNKSNTYVDGSRILHPDIDTYAYSLKGAYPVDGITEYVIECINRDTGSKKYEIVVIPELSFAIKTIHVFANDRILHTFDRIIHERTSVGWLPKTWRMQTYLGDPARLFSHSECTTISSLLNNNDIPGQCNISISKGEILSSADDDKLYLCKDNKLVLMSNEGGSTIYIIVLVMFGAIVIACYALRGMRRVNRLRES